MKSEKESSMRALPSVKMPILAGLLLWIFLTVGCAATDAVKTIRPGDTAYVGITCRLRDGRLVMASDIHSVPEGLANFLYIPRKEKGNLKLTAVDAGAPWEAVRERPFEEEILSRVAMKIVGMKTGETQHVELQAEDVPDRNEENYVLSVSRTRLRDKEMRLPAEDFRRQKNKNPEVGDTYTIDPAFPGKVISVDNGTALIRFSGKEGETVETAFGKALVFEDEKQFRVRIDARVGDLVRTGPFVGRVITVDDRQIVIDYRNPFGRETLLCDVKISKIEPPAQRSEIKKGEKVGPKTSSTAESEAKSAGSCNASDQKKGGGERP